MSSKSCFFPVVLCSLGLVVAACDSEVDVGTFEDGSGGGSTSTSTGRGGDDTQQATVGSGSTGTVDPTSGSTGTVDPTSGSTGTVDPTTSSSTGGGGSPCGGLGNPGCGEGEFCDFPDGQCDFADGTGICTQAPQACPFDVVDVVCACNGEVYSSPCFANLAGTDVSTIDLVCGVPCGGKSGGTCGDDEYCSFVGDACGMNDEQGVCVQRPIDCETTDESPVCACDGTTYWSACEAAEAGVDLWGGEDFCPEPDRCGGIGGLECAGDEFCDYPDDLCGGDDSLGICRARPESCPEPNADEAVCGCDMNLTHGSVCLANLAGFDATSGPPLECGGA